MKYKTLYNEYKKAPDVTKERLYIEAVQSVLSNSSKVMIDVEGGNNLMYLPLDQLINNTKQPRPRINDETQKSDNDTSIMDRINANKNNFNLRKRDLYNE